MTLKARAALVAAAVACWMAALQLLASAGLPNRADQTALIWDEQVFAPEVGSLAPPVSGYSLDGDRFSLLDYRGRTVIVNFWATWCEPCRYELPELIALVDDHDSVALLAINGGDSVEAIDAWLTRIGFVGAPADVTFVLDDAGDIARQYAIRGRPTTLVIDRSGMIRHAYYGMVTRQDLEPVLNQLERSL